MRPAEPLVIGGWLEAAPQSIELPDCLTPHALYRFGVQEVVSPNAAEFICRGETRKDPDVSAATNTRVSSTRSPKSKSRST